MFNDIMSSYGVEEPTDHFMSTVIGLHKGLVKVDGSESVAHLVDVVDGQQRITTLILLLKAISKELDRTNATQVALLDTIDNMLVNADDAHGLLLNTNHDPNEHFGKYLRTGNFLHSRIASTMEDRQLLSAMRECEAFVENWIDADYPIEELVNHLFNRLKFVYHQIAEERVVYSVFESQNSRGLEITGLDSLRSKLMAIVFKSMPRDDNIDLVDEVHRIWSNIYRIIGTRLGLSGDILRFAATLRSFPYPNQPLREERTAVEQLSQEASGGPSDVIRISKFLRRVARLVSTMDKERQIRRLDVIIRPDQARLLAIAVRLRNNVDKDMILRRWESVTFRIYGMAGRSTRTARAEYTRLAWQIENERWLYSTERIMAELQRIGDYYCPIESAVSKLRQTNCYEILRGEPLIYFFRKYEDHLSSKAGQKLDKKFWRRNWNGEDAADSIEHILPQSSGRGDHVHWLGNLMLLPPSLNISLSDRSPKEKAESYRESGLRTATEVAEQVSLGWTKKDIERRENALLKWAKQEWAD